MSDEELAKALYEWFGRETEYRNDGAWVGGDYCMAGWAEDTTGLMRPEECLANDLTEVSLDSSWDFIALAKFIKSLSIQ